MEKILIIDDEKPTLSMFRLFLGAYGYTVFIAENGEEGIEIFTREKPSIVFTDIKMPGMDGLAVLSAIKEIRKETQVIVITGHGDMDLAVKALDLDATDFINKPVQRTALDAALKRAEERARATITSEETITRKTAGGIPILTLRGRIDGSARNPFLEAEDALAQAGETAAVINFDPNFSINGEGIAALINLLTACRKRGIAVALSGVSENFTVIFEMTGIARLAAVFNTMAQAIRHLKEGRKTV